MNASALRMAVLLLLQSRVAVERGRRTSVPRRAKAGTRAHLSEAADHGTQSHHTPTVLSHARLQYQPGQGVREHRRLRRGDTETGNWKGGWGRHNAR